MKGYKAFEKGMICKGKQYAENTVFEEDTAEICQSGMHFCVNPLDILNYYPLVDDNGNLSDFVEVEALDEPITDDGEKYCTKKLKVGAKLSLAGFIKSSFEFIKESCKTTDGKGKTRKKLTANLPQSEIVANLPQAEIVANLPQAELIANLPQADIVANLPQAEITANLN